MATKKTSGKPGTLPGFSPAAAVPDKGRETGKRPRFSGNGLRGLSLLGSGPRAAPAKALESFPNPNPGRDYLIRMEIPEFTCLCPKTGQPDFATLYLDYYPDRACVELKSLKLYVWSFRNEGKFHEAVTNEILEDLVRATKPRFMRLTAEFLVRGGIYTTVVAEHRQRGWKAPEHVDLGSREDQGY
jgi:7-cyano-7-deazaguanine reductase